jgi:hypothetical protein
MSHPGLRNLQNAVLVDAAAVSDAFSSYDERLAGHQLLDVFNFIEQIILRDKIIAVGGKRLVASHAWELLELWDREGALWIPKARVPVASIPSPPAPEGGWQVGGNERSRIIRGTRRLIAAEQLWEQPGMPFNAHQGYFDSIVQPDIQDGIFDLVAQLKRVAGNTLAQYQLLQPKPAFIGLELPPLAFSVFRRIDRIEQLPEETLNQRRRFFELRLQLRELVELLRDPTKTDQQKFCEVRKWKRSWKNLECDPLGEKVYRFQVGSTELLKAIWACGKLVTIGPDTEMVSAMLNAGPTILEAAAQAYGKTGPKSLMLRPVYDTFAEYFAASRIERTAVVRRVVGRQLSNARHSASRNRYGYPPATMQRGPRSWDYLRMGPKAH